MLVWSQLELHIALICACAPAVKGIIVAAVQNVSKKLGKVKKEPFSYNHGYVEYDKSDLEKSAISVSVATVHKYEC